MTPDQHKALEVSRTTTFTDFAKEKGTLVVGGTGRGILERAQVAGRALLMFYQALGFVSQVGRALPMLLKQIEFVGFGSLVVLSLISGLTGMIMAVQMGATLQDYGALNQLGGLIGVTFARELGPIWRRRCLPRVPTGLLFTDSGNPGYGSPPPRGGDDRRT